MKNDETKWKLEEIEVFHPEDNEIKDDETKDNEEDSIKE